MQTYLKTTLGTLEMIKSQMKKYEWPTTWMLLGQYKTLPESGSGFQMPRVGLDDSQIRIKGNYGNVNNTDQYLNEPLHPADA